jgi:hypothetical protein
MVSKEMDTCLTDNAEPEEKVDCSVRPSYPVSNELPPEINNENTVEGVAPFLLESAFEETKFSLLF